jgi:hypothetical protein
MNNASRSGKSSLMAFLILVAASVAVVGSMIVSALFDLVPGRKRPSATTQVIESDSEIANRSNLERAFSDWRRERGVPRTIDWGIQWMFSRF